MSDHPDLPKANHALQVLRQARSSRNEAAAVMIGDLIYEIAYTGQRSPEIEDAHQTAWLRQCVRRCQLTGQTQSWYNAH